jgi:hypothetical protein
VNAQTAITVGLLLLAVPAFLTFFLSHR